MSDATDFAALLKLTPQAAVDYLIARGRHQPTFNWQDMWQQEHTLAFTISRLAHADLLQTFADKITASVKGDLSRSDYMRDMKAALQQAGWWGEKQVLDPQTGEIVTTTFNPSRLKLIYDTNARTAHTAGRWQSFEASRATHPYLRYITKHDERVRASHAAFDGVTLPIDDPFWDTHTPPLGYRCRCRLVAVSQRDYDKGKTPTGAPMKKTAPDLGTQEFVNKRTGEVTRVPVGITPGFDYNPGKERLARLGQLLLSRLAGADARLGATAAHHALANQRVFAGINTAYQQMVEQKLDEMDRGVFIDHKQFQFIGALPIQAIDALERMGATPQSGLIGVRDADILHWQRPGKNAPIPRDWLINLPAALKNPAALLLDTSHDTPAILMVYPSPGDAAHKIVVQLDYKMKTKRPDGKRERITANIVNTGRVVDSADLNRYRLIGGAL